MHEESLLIPTGMRMAIPEGYEIQVRPRSGLALKHQITVLNTPGTIFCNIRGGCVQLLITLLRTSVVVPVKRIRGQ